MKKYILTLTLLAASSGSMLMAQDPQISGAELVQRSRGWESDPNITISILLVLILMLAVVIWILGRDVSRQLHLMVEKKLSEAGVQPVKRATWLDLFRRIPGTEDKLMKDHVYDSIQEYDNSPPAWFNWLFYLSIVWAAGYLLYYHVFNLGDLQIASYEKQMKEAEIVVAKAQENAIKLAELPPFTDAAKLELGKQTFQKNCTMCHGDHAQGNIGPNLTDEYWLHGGKYSDIFKTIFNGVPEKGMVSWKKSLKPEELRAVASYVHTLKGTNPPNPKAPQGEKYTETASK